MAEPDAAKTLAYDFNGSLWVAPVGTALPLKTAFYPVTPPYLPTTPWLNTGYIDEAGPAFETKDSITTLRAWQALADVRKVSKGKTTTLAFSLLEWTLSNVEWSMGLVDDGAGLLMPSSVAVEKAVLIIVTDGANQIGIGFPRASLEVAAKVTFKPADWASLPVLLTALQPTTGASFKVYLPATFV